MARERKGAFLGGDERVNQNRNRIEIESNLWPSKGGDFQRHPSTFQIKGTGFVFNYFIVRVTFWLVSVCLTN